MTQQILFLNVVLIGAYYARKYGKKAKRDIEKYNQNKEQDKIKKTITQISNPCHKAKNLTPPQLLLFTTTLTNIMFYLTKNHYI